MEYFQKLNLFEIDWTAIKKSRPEHDPNERVYAICCQLEIDNDVISGRNVMTLEGYAV